MKLEVYMRKKFKNFSLEVSFQTEQEVLGLFGASGSGKSMTFRCIAGIETPDEGRIVLNGRVLYDSSKNINLSPQERNIGYLFQDYALFPNMTVEENILLGIRCGQRTRENHKKFWNVFLEKKKKNREQEQQILNQYIEQFFLSGLEKQYPDKLSGGQKQRTAVARMIATKPELILLDEPFSALDEFLKGELVTQFKEMMTQFDTPVLFVSHNKEEIYRLCGKVACMDNGRLEQPVETSHFFSKPETLAAAKLAGCKNFSKLKWIDANHAVAQDWNVVLNWKKKQNIQLQYAGIFSHHFYQKACNQEGENRFPIVKIEQTEGLQEWEHRFWTEEKGNILFWNIAKMHGEMPKLFEVKELFVNSDEILLLK